MVVLNRIYTRTGDDGTTALGSGDRRKKYDLRVSAYGTLDEVNATLGLVRLHTAGEAALDSALGRIQNDLFDVEADLCLSEKGPGGARLTVTDAQVDWIEGEIDRLNADLAPLRSFILPGGTPAASYMHLARTICRRAERIMVELKDQPGETVTDASLKYVNRLSDFLFVAGRYANDKGARDVLWAPGRESLMPARTGLAVALVALGCSPAWAANPLDDLIKPQVDASACFSRVYDAAHLRSHPRQKTTAMTVWLKYRPPLSGGSGIILSVALAITQRGDPAQLYSQGGCGWDERANRDTSNHRLIKTYPKQAGTVCMQSARPDVFDSVSAEEGGDLILDRGRDRDTLMVYLDEGLTMVKRADRSNQRGIEFGAEDRVFLLLKTANKECSAVEEAVTTPEPAQGSKVSPQAPAAR